MPQTRSNATVDTNARSQPNSLVNRAIQRLSEENAKLESILSQLGMLNHELRQIVDNSYSSPSQKRLLVEELEATHCISRRHACKLLNNKLSRTDRPSDSASDGLDAYRHNQAESREHPRLPADTSSAAHSNADQFLPHLYIEPYNQKTDTPADLSPQAKSPTPTLTVDIYEQPVTRPNDKLSDDQVSQQDKLRTNKK